MQTPQSKPLLKSQITQLISDPHNYPDGWNNWLALEVVLREHGMGSPNNFIAAAATVAVETAHTFKPIHELGNQAYFKRMYGNRHDYEEDANGLWKWRGRGFIQLTGENNYRQCGRDIGLDLLKNPDWATIPTYAARIFSWFWGLHHCDIHAEKKEWKTVRTIVNGGTNGLADYMKAVKLLGG